MAIPKKMFATLVLAVAVIALAANAAQGTEQPPAPGVIKFVRMWISADGATHIEDCTVEGMQRKPLPGGKSAQYVRDLGDLLSPTDVIFTQMTSENPWHQCPVCQFVVTLGGSWAINTTDGGFAVMRPGDVLYQDDYRGLVVNGTSPSHYSQSVDGPCNQMVISVAGRKAEIDPVDRCDWARQAAAAFSAPQRRIAASAQVEEDSSTTAVLQP